MAGKARQAGTSRGRPRTAICGYPMVPGMQISQPIEPLPYVTSWMLRTWPTAFFAHALQSTRIGNESAGRS